MSAFEVLNTLIAQAPAALQPALNQLGRIVQGVQGELQTHVGENNGSFGDVATQITQMAERASGLEKAVTAINTSLVNMSGSIDAHELKLNKLDAILGSAGTLEQAPTIAAIRDEVTSLKTSFADLSNIKSQLGDQATLEGAPTIMKLKSQRSLH